MGIGSSFRLFTLFGTEVRAHLMFLVLLALVAFTGMSNLTWVMLLFFFVLIHEFAHIGMARKFGRHCNLVVLHFFGAGAMMGPVGVPIRDIMIALAGPMSNFLMAAIFYTIRYRFGENQILDKCIMANMVLGIFNLIPIWPMDGGRVLVNLLKMLGFSSAKATDITFYISTASAIGVIFFFHSLMMIILMALIWIALYSTWRKGHLLST